MPTTVNILPEFHTRLKRLKRRYPAVTNEIRKLVQQLEQDERPGDKIAGVGYDVYKVRMANPSAQRGKSVGFRAIYYVHLANQLMLVTIYSKTEQINISPVKIRKVLEDFDSYDP